MTKRRLCRIPLQLYRNRDYVAHLLDDKAFDELNSDGGFLSLTGCLDALEELPAGAMRGDDYHDGWSVFDQIYWERGRTLAELQEEARFTNEIIEKILSEKSS